MMTPEQIDDMRADAEAGTPGPWAHDNNDGYSINRIYAEARGHFAIAEVIGDDAETEANASRIARVPDMEATIIAQAAEIERLKSGIPWRDGPPPAEWRDGREVLVWAKNAHHGFWRAGSWHIVNGSGAQIVQSMITHHAAITKPGEPHADT